MDNSDSFKQAHYILQQIRAEVRKAVVGQKEVISHVLAAFLAGGHVLLEGVPGLGKTLLVLALARTMGAKFSRIQFTPDLMPTDVTGHAMWDQATSQFRIRKGPIFCNLLLADEINRAPAKTQAALLEVMQERQVTIEGDAFKLDPPFITLATQNPVEQEGTYPLPEAQLDRFLLKVLIQYPSIEEEVSIVNTVTHGSVGGMLDVEAVQQIIDLKTALNLQQICAQVTVDRRIMEYAVQLSRATRENIGFSMGAGPRGGIALVRAGRALALLSGRSFVTPDDIRRASLPALRHRVSLSPEFEIEGMSVDQALINVVNSVAPPTQ